MIKKVAYRSIQTKDVDRFHPISLFSDNKLRMTCLELYLHLWGFKNKLFLLKCIIIIIIIIIINVC
jgi:hypothetical protein